MAQSLFDTDDPVAAEVDRRIRELKADPEELLRRFDWNGDRRLDAAEIRVMRDLLTREAEALVLGEEGEVIGGRYKVLAPIGHGSQGHTFLARDEETADFVALKEIDFAGLGNWDAFETFERESKVLGGLNHAAIPRMRESFRIGEGDDVRLIMVQDFVEGKNLETLLRENTLFEEARLRNYAEQLLGVLTYLHSHSPPVLHRDVKPANIIERPNGSLALVDFGAAQGHGHMTAVIGTSGYIPAEQLMGRAMPASDIYAMGATLIHLATRQHPSEISNGLELRWASYASVTDEFASWLDRCVAPMPEDRFPTANQALAAYRRKVEREGAELTLPSRGEQGEEATEFHQPSRSIAVIRGRPSDCEIEVRRRGDRLVLHPHPSSRTDPEVVAGLASLAGMTIIVIAVAIDALSLLLLLAALVVPLAIYYATRQISHLECSPKGITLHYQNHDTVRWYPQDQVQGVSSGYQNNQYLLLLHTSDGKNHTVARSGREKDVEWVEAIMRRWLVEQRMGAS